MSFTACFNGIYLVTCPGKTPPLPDNKLITPARDPREANKRAWQTKGRSSTERLERRPGVSGTRRRRWRRLQAEEAGGAGH